MSEDLDQDQAIVQNIEQFGSDNPQSIANQWNTIYGSLKATQPKIGEMCWTMLTLNQHQSQAVGIWQACDGSSCAGTKYAIVSGNNTVPNTAALITIGNVFIRVG